MDVTLQYFDGCPNWVVARNRLAEALAQVGKQTDIAVQSVSTPEDAERLRFRGSPTIVVDGRDLFGDEPAAGGLACRIYATPSGPQGAPSLEQIIAALAER